MLGCYAPVAPASILGLWGVIKSPRSSVQRSAFDLDDAIVPARLEDLAVENTDGYHVKKRPNQPQNGPNALLFMVAKPRPEDALSLSVISPTLNGGSTGRAVFVLAWVSARGSHGGRVSTVAREHAKAES